MRADAVPLTEDEEDRERLKRTRLLTCAIVLSVLYAVVAVSACVWWATQIGWSQAAGGSPGGSDSSGGERVVFRTSSDSSSQETPDVQVATTSIGNQGNQEVPVDQDDVQQYWILNLPESWRIEHVEKFKTGVEEYGGMQCDGIEGELKSVRLLASRVWVDKIVKRFPDIEFAEEDKTIQAVQPTYVGEQKEDDGSVGQFQALRDDERRLFDSDNPLVQACLRGRCVEKNPPWGVGDMDPTTDWFLLRWGMGENVHIYIADTGIRTTHRDFVLFDFNAGTKGTRMRAVPTIETIDGSVRECNPEDRSCADDHNGHGTHCAATAGGLRYGIAKFATLHAVKILKDDGSGSLWGFMKAIDWIVARGQRPAIVSASLSGRGDSPSLDRTMATAVNAGVVVVVAAGNEGEDARGFFPGNSQPVICVGAVEEGNTRAGYSNYGADVDIFAPGSGVLSAGIESDRSVQIMSGTSQATPHVAGVVALLFWEQPDAPVSDVRARLTGMAADGAVLDAGGGSPNKLLRYAFSALTPGGEHGYTGLQGAAPKEEDAPWKEVTANDGKQCVDWSSLAADEKYTVGEQKECQWKAMENGHVYYQFSADSGRCATAFDCDELQPATSGPWRTFWEGGESERGGVIFDCWAGFDDWREGWSNEKKEQCCRRHSMGCSRASKPALRLWLLTVIAALPCCLGCRLDAA